MALIPYPVKRARYFAVERHPSGKIVTEYDRQRKADGAKKRRRKAQRKRRRHLKTKTYISEVLRMARAALGYKPLNGPLGRKLSAEHKAALHDGRNRYHQAKRAKEAMV
jgi:hypothetical protein